MLPTASNAALPGAVQNLGLLDGTANYYTLGSGLYPLYAQSTTTTANTTNGSPTITVASAANIAIGDVVSANSLSFTSGTVWVTDIVGTTVTLSANATSTQTGASVTFGVDRFDAGNTALTNVLGAQYGYFGRAASGHSTWVAKYWTGADYPGDHTLFAVSDDGLTGGLFAARSSDNENGSDSAVIGLGIEAVNDGMGTAHTTWSIYDEGRTTVGSVPLQHFNMESVVINGWSPSAESDPYTTNPPGSTFNVRLGSGIGGTTSNTVTAALDIVNETGNYSAGIIFGSDALDTSAGRVAPAVALATTGQALTWYSGAGTRSWNIYANTAVTTGAPYNLILGDGVASLDAAIYATPKATSGDVTAAKFSSASTGSTRIVIDNTAPGGHQWEIRSLPTSGTLDFVDRTSSSQRLSIGGFGGVMVGSPTGGDQAFGTLNVASAVYDNGTAPTGTAGSGYARATAPVLTDPILSGFKVSTSTLTKTSDTALATVPGLSITLTADKTYNCHGHLTGTANASGGLKAAFVASGGLTATSASFTGFLWDGSTAVARTTVTALGSNIAANTAAYTDLDIEGAIVVNAGGTLNLQAAQNASFGTATTVLANSTLNCVRVN